MIHAMNDNLMNLMKQGFNEMLKNFMASNLGNTEIKFFTGKVENNNDPDKEGKCQIRIYGLFPDAIPNDDLPWALPDFNFIGGTKGSFIVPPIGSVVRVYFDGGDIYAPMYTTKAFNKEHLDFQADKNADYPDTMVFFETDTGEYFKINRKTGVSTYKHTSGTIIIVDVDGNIQIDNEAGNNGNLTVNIAGNVTLNAGADADIIAQGNVHVNSLGGQVLLGSNLAGQLINNLPVCLVTGAPHTIGNVNVKC